MTVAELIEHLQTFPPEMPVMTFHRDFRPLEVPVKVDHYKEGRYDCVVITSENK